jgi:oligosaccharide repeat unit polymerase
MSSSGFLTYLEYGANATAGTGTTVISDFYLDFGVFGVLIGMVFVGWFYHKISFAIRAKRGSLFFLCLFFVFYSQSIALARSAFLPILCSSIMVFVVLKLAELTFVSIERQVGVQENEDTTAGQGVVGNLE